MRRRSAGVAACGLVLVMPAAAGETGVRRRYGAVGSRWRAATSLAAACGLALAAPATAVGEWRWPVDGAVVEGFANRGGPYAAGQHRGIDVAARPGTPVLAAVAGTVRFAGRVGSSGLTVSIRTADDRFDTSYLHLDRLDVRAGASVPAGARIGAAGTSGVPSSSEPHLHFGVRDAGTRRYRDPLALLPPRPSIRDLPRGAPAPVRVPLGRAPAPVRIPVGRAPAPVRVPLGRAPGPVRVPLGRAPAPVGRHTRASAEPGADRRSWAIACAALIAAAALLGAGSPSARRRLRAANVTAVAARLVAGARHARQLR